MEPKDLPVVILCGGLGTRLREETEFKPKPMVPIGERPILWHLMSGYARFGCDRFVLCLGYRGDVIKDYFYNYEAMNSDFTVELGKRRVTFHASKAEDWRVTLSDTGAEALTGARIKRIQRFIDTDTFFATYGDGVADVDMDALLRFHKAHGKLATITAVHPPSRFGELAVAGDAVAAFHEKPMPGDLERPDGGYINGGFFVFERGVFDYLTDDDACILEREPMAKLAADGQLMAYRHNGFWQCMDTLRDVKLLNDLWAAGEAPWLPQQDAASLRSAERRIPLAAPLAPERAAERP